MPLFLQRDHRRCHHHSQRSSSRHFFLFFLLAVHVASLQSLSSVILKTEAFSPLWSLSFCGNCHHSHHRQYPSQYQKNILQQQHRQPHHHHHHHCHGSSNNRRTMVKSKKEETAEEHRNPPSLSNNNNIRKPSLSSLFSSILLKYLWTILTKLSTRRIISILQTSFPAYSDTLFYFPTDKFDCFDVVECKDDQTNEIKEQQGLFAITIDDGLCRSSSPSSSLILQLSTLLSTYNATATFFICSDYTLHNPTITKQAREVLLKTNNCDIGCHMKNDDCHAGSYTFMKKDEWKEEFEREWDGIEWLLCGKGDVWSESKVPNCRKENVGLEDEGGDDGPLSERTNTQSIANPKENNDGGEAEETRWFRAPQGVYTPSMRSTLRSLSSSSTSTAKSTNLHRINYIHVLGDAYCDDWKLASYDPSFVANTMLQQIQPGSIAIFHMPEEGFRRECFDVLERVLEGAKERGLRGVALRELWERRKMG